MPVHAVTDEAAQATQRWLVGLLLLAIAVRIATLGAYPLMDNTEARYAEIARKMVETGDWVTPQFRYGVAFWSKPPLSTWLAAIAYLVLGVSEFAARLASLLPSLAAAWLVWDLAARRGGRDLALKATLVLVTTPLFFLSSGAVMTDPALLLGTTLSMAGFWHAMTRTGPAARTWGYLFFVGLAIGLLAKGPVGVVLTMLPIGAWVLWKGRIADTWRRLPWITGTLLAAALTLPWYLLAESRTPGFLEYFIVGEHWKRYTVSGWDGDRFGTAHSRPRGTIWLFGVLSTLPWSAAWLGLWVTLRRAKTSQATAPDDGWRAYLWCWWLAPLVFFTPAGNILPTYVLPGAPAFALLVAGLWTAAGDTGRLNASIKFNALVMPFLTIGAVLFVLPRISPTYTHRGFVAEVEAQRATPDQALVYLSEVPSSAEFYARGKVVTAASPEELDRYLHDAKPDFFALKDDQLRSLPSEARERLVAIARSGRYQLLRERDAALAVKP
jgi:4-amino-4-deoxy-L-arabinose transferase-like glycosyltransferase